jgi:hypothetical protein
MRFSASSCARLVNRDRIASSSWVRNATIGRFLQYAHPRVISDNLFGRHRWLVDIPEISVAGSVARRAS